jgi:hypothetical protein
MLALTHHFIVRIAALRVGISHFTAYAILGDDVVIANKQVAWEYHDLMTRYFGVDINLGKSLEGRVLEFAKRIIGETEFTPIGPKNLLLAIKSPASLPSVFLDLKGKGFALSEEQFDLLIDRCPFNRKEYLKTV